MADNKAPHQDRKPSYISPLIIAVIVVAIGIVTFVRMPAPEPPAPPAKVEPQVAAAPTTPAPAPPIAPPGPLVREDLVMEASRAASQFAAEGRLTESTAAMVGRRFAISIAFGCGGLQNMPSASQMSVAYDAANRTIKLTAQPGVWTNLPIIQGLPDPSTIDVVEGFWIPRPWTSMENCPVQTNYPVPATPTPSTAQTLGLAQLFPTDGSRLSRHADRPYEFTQKVPEAAAAMLSSTYQLVLEGRITGFDKETALRCWMESPYHQPVCLYAVTLDRVSFQEAASGKQIASWTE
jgi:hypothetical protein